MRISDWSSDVCSSDLIVSTFMETEPYSGAHVCMPSIISVSGLCKSYATGTKALDNVDLEIEQGEIFALLGANGAGKTTLINIICGLVTASAGQILVGGHDKIGRAHV